MSKYEPVSAEVVAALQTALGAEYVRTDAETLEKYKTDEETDPRYHHLPEVVVLAWQHRRSCGGHENRQSI